MNAKLAMIVRAARGPVMLITLGFLFVMQQSGALSFRQTWPLLLIVFGVMKLLDRMLMPRYVPPGVPPSYVPPQPPPAPPYGGVPR